MDRVEKSRARKRQSGRYANKAEVASRDRPLLETPAGRSDDAGLDAHGNPTIADAEVHRGDVGAVPRSEVTGAHEPGTGDETIDGLDETEEAVRIAAEDTPIGSGREDRRADLPVFEKRFTKAKV